jgi:Tfp pilus assembly protein PilN
LLLILIGLLQQNILTSLLGELRDSSAELVDRKMAVSQLQVKVKRHQPSALLREKLEQLTQELNGKRVLSEYLKGHEVPDGEKYSAVMEDVASFHDNQLWISEMRFDQLGISLKGYALNALAIPQWLDRLQQSPYFVGKEFTVLNLEDQDNKAIAFEINSISLELHELGSGTGAGGSQ